MAHWLIWRSPNSSEEKLRMTSKTLSHLLNLSRSLTNFLFKPKTYVTSIVTPLCALQHIEEILNTLCWLITWKIGIPKRTSSDHNSSCSTSRVLQRLSRWQSQPPWLAPPGLAMSQHHKVVDRFLWLRKCLFCLIHCSVPPPNVECLCSRRAFSILGCFLLSRGVPFFPQVYTSKVSGTFA